MSGYGDVKAKKFRNRILAWLGNKEDIEIKPGGKHNTKVKHLPSGEVFPIPSSHPTI